MHLLVGCVLCRGLPQQLPQYTTADEFVVGWLIVCVMDVSPRVAPGLFDYRLAAYTTPVLYPPSHVACIVFCVVSQGWGLGSDDACR